MPLVDLDSGDIRWCVKRLPKLVRELMEENPERLILAGGFIRAAISGEKINDIDLFSPSLQAADDMARNLREKIPGSVVAAKTANAITVLLRDGDKCPVQFITRWVFQSGQDVVASFDFTIASAAIWCKIGIDGKTKNWAGVCDSRFYRDLAAKRLVYRSPVRNEDAGGSLLRAMKFSRMGYRMPLGSLAGVVARLAKAVENPNRYNEEEMAGVLKGLLFEVDPNGIEPGPEE